MKKLTLENASVLIFIGLAIIGALTGKWIVVLIALLMIPLIQYASKVFNEMDAEWLKNEQKRLEQDIASTEDDLARYYRTPTMNMWDY